MIADLERMRELARKGAYRVKLHAARHIIEEGFTEQHCVEAILSGEVLEEYLDEDRCLIVGTFQWTARTAASLHVVCDYSQSDRIEIVTAYIPQPPAWITPMQRGNRR